jgi:hypothetical protein
LASAKFHRQIFFQADQMDSEIKAHSAQTLASGSVAVAFQTLDSTIEALIA